MWMDLLTLPDKVMKTWIFMLRRQKMELQKVLAMLGAIPVECSGKRSVIT